MGIDPEQAKQAQVLFDRATGRSMRAYRLIASLLYFMRHGVSSARETLVGELEQVAQEFVLRPDFGTGEQREKALQSTPDTAQAAADNTIADAIVASEAASIAFMHLMLDAAAHDYCRVCSLLDPNDWFPEVQTEKVTLAEARGDFDALLRKAVAREIGRLKNASLPNKVQVLQTVCKPGPVQLVKGYTYDADRMKRIDLFRHEVVHEKLVKSPNDVIADVDFMERTQVYLSALVAHRHGLTLGPDSMIAVIG
jgi:hypothetical protein